MHMIRMIYHNLWFDSGGAVKIFITFTYCVAAVVDNLCGCTQLCNFRSYAHLRNRVYPSISSHMTIEVDYLIQGKLDNTTHTISYDQLRILYEDNQKEAEESRRITESSYRDPFSLRMGMRVMSWIQNTCLEIRKLRG